MSRAPRSRIGKAPSTLQRQGVPIASTMIASLTPLIPAITTAPAMPPWGLLLLLGWRMLHRNIWPAWLGLPLGLWDDMFSGQPLGSSMLLWTLALLGLDMLDRRMVWRDFIQEWGIAAAMIVVALILGLMIANTTGGNTALIVLLPQIAMSILAFPLVARACAVFDAWRLR
jgi:rod shape-determining protein MreD